MGLRCSLFGHAFGDPVTEREREQRGDEEVVTTRKLRTCSRCGAENVLSENTEVRHLGAGGDQTPPTEAAADVQAQEPPSSTTEQSGQDPTASQTDEDVDVGDLVESAEAESSPGKPMRTDASMETSEPPAETEVDASTEEETAPSDADDAGIIIDEGPDDAEPATETEQTGGSASFSDPTSEPTDTATEAPSQPSDLSESAEGSEDAIEDSGPAADPHRTSEPAGTETPVDVDSPSRSQSGHDPAPQAESQKTNRYAETSDSTASSDATDADDKFDVDSPFKGASEAETEAWKSTSSEGDQEGGTATKREDPSFQFGLQEDSSDTAANSARRGPSGIASEGPLDVDEQTDMAFEALECPECGFSEPTSSSLRAGDICPECHRGYLAGRR